MGKGRLPFGGGAVVLLSRAAVLPGTTTPCRRPRCGSYSRRGRPAGGHPTAAPAGALQAAAAPRHPLLPPHATHSPLLSVAARNVGGRCPPAIPPTHARATAGGEGRPPPLCFACARRDGGRAGGISPAAGRFISRQTRPRPPRRPGDRYRHGALPRRRPPPSHRQPFLPPPDPPPDAVVSSPPAPPSALTSSPTVPRACPPPPSLHPPSPPDTARLPHRPRALPLQPPGPPPLPNRAPSQQRYGQPPTALLRFPLPPPSPPLSLCPHEHAVVAATSEPSRAPPSAQTPPPRPPPSP